MTHAPSEAALPAATSSALHVTSPAPPAPAGWSLARRLAFRFTSVYLLLHVLPFPLEILPGTQRIGRAYREAWQAVVPWVGRHVLHLGTDLTASANGSGDTTYHYVQLPCFLALAAVATAIGSARARTPTRHETAHALVRVCLRYFLAYTLVSYGLSKVLWMQFSFPSPEKLVQPIGESSPMGLLWTFMGYSRGYNLFTGGMELLGGVLLLFRRTTTLGAVLLATVMTNVVALNLAYDVPVKVFSFHLLLMAVFLLLPDLERIANVLVLNRPTRPAVFRTPFAHPWLERGSRAVKVLFAGWILYTDGSKALARHAGHGEDAPRHPLHGGYVVESFTRDGQAVPLLAGDATAWRYVLVGTRERLALRFMDDSGKRFRMADAPEQRLKMTANSYPGEQDPEAFTLAWSRPDAEHLVVEGVFRGASVQARLKKVDASTFRLVDRGFHWIQEYPFNR
ncbi:DoxX family protein [Corallococcus aberystwythensis]|uniref:DoxX family protein n=1 Tax=Corallococcus aberystwythensis TaxID=2316722 RepID=A0A3A8PLX7_9BACT|nr:DoxX family protein [Corallococcus aberystwythensis]RKH57198.1 hypothetical protein D7W81_31740 [Corallococcus aberystwythensis]